MILAWIMSLNILWLKRILLFLYDHWKGILLLIAGIIVLVWISGSSFCGKSEVKIDMTDAEKVNTRNEAELKKGMNEIFEKVDSQREISDEKREAIIKKVENDAKFGKNVTAEDLENLVKESKER